MSGDVTISGEFGLIEQQLRPLSRGMKGAPALADAMGLADDAALLSCPDGCELVVAKDAIVQSVHFLADDPPASIAQKLLRSNLSDLAAMAAEPVCYLTALMLPGHIDNDWLSAFALGLRQDQDRFDIHLIGGDITATSGPLAMSCTVIGRLPKGMAIRRGGARAGDDIWVSGHLGDAALGLRIRQGLAADEETAIILLERYRRPRPRLDLGIALRGIANAMIDVSDGLVADLGHIARQSAVGAEIDAARVPISEHARDVPGARDAALSGGDDYELLFTADPAQAEQIAKLSNKLDLAITRIGKMKTGRDVDIVDANGQPLALKRHGWTHR